MTSTTRLSRPRRRRFDRSERLGSSASSGVSVGVAVVAVVSASGRLAGQGRRLLGRRRRDRLGLVAQPPRRAHHLGHRGGQVVAIRVDDVGDDHRHVVASVCLERDLDAPVRRLLGRRGRDEDLLDDVGADEVGQTVEQSRNRSPTRASRSDVSGSSSGWPVMTLVTTERCGWLPASSWRCGPRRRAAGRRSGPW